MNALLVGFSQDGGAAIAARRLMRGLAAAGLTAEMMLARQESPIVAIARQKAANLIWRAAQGANRESIRSINAFPTAMPARINAHPADIVHLHWIGAETIRIEELPRIRKPAIWTLHDEWAYCGSEHYAAAGDERYACGYGAPFRYAIDRLDAWVWRRKMRSWKDFDVTIVCPSRWLAERARRSAVFRGKVVEWVPNTLPLDTFAPGDRRAARQRLGLPLDRRLVGFGAYRPTQEGRKGFGALQDVLERLAAASVPADMVIFGAGASEALPSLPLPAHWLGVIDGEARMADVYRACDVVVCPSDRENLPNVVLEAMACGTPCVAFDIGGLPDLVEHERSGFLADAADAAAFTAGIVFCVDAARNAGLGQAARAWVERHFAETVVAERHRAIYEDAVRRSLRRGRR